LEAGASPETIEKSSTQGKKHRNTQRKAKMLKISSINHFPIKNSEITNFSEYWFEGRIWRN